MTAALWLYRIALRLLPAELRRDFGADMEQMLRDQWRDTRGGIARLSLLAAAIADVARQASAHRASASSRASQTSALRAVPADFRHGLRLLRRYPASAVIAVATLALGIGVNTAIFTVVDSVLLRTLPYPQPSQLVTIYENRPREGTEYNAVAPADYIDWRATAHSFSAMSGVTENTVVLTGAGEPVQLVSGLVSAGFFDVIGVQPSMGRGFRPEEEVRGRHRVAVITYGMWRRYFNADPNIIGRAITLTGNPWVVVGVMPESYVSLDRNIELFLPLTFGTSLSRGSHSIEVYARLNPGVTIAQARNEMNRITADIATRFPDSNTGHGASVFSMQTDLVSGVRPALMLLTVAVGMVLLLASVNVANLMLVRSVRRAREMAVRAALGADRWRLMTQSFAECLAVSVVGGVAGVVLAGALIRALPAVLPEQIGIVSTEALHIDARVLLAAAVITALTTILFGVLPARHAARADVVDALKQGGRGAASISRRVRIALVISEVTLASFTLIGAGLVVRSFAAMSAQPLGLDPHGRIAVELSAPTARYATDDLRLNAMNELDRRLSAIPGVAAVGGIDILPLSGEDSRRGVVIEGLEPVADSPTRMHPRVVTPSYFRAAGMTLLRGRGFTDQDTAQTPPVSVITEAAAKQFWPGQDPVGKRWRMNQDDAKWSMIVGVAADVKHWGLSRPANPIAFMPLAQNIGGDLTFIAKTNLDVAAFAAAVRDVVRGFDPNMPAANIRTMDAVVATSLRVPRALTLLMATFGTMALLLAGIGIYGVMSQLVASRVQEIGVRVALGARPAQILRPFLSGCAWQAGIGIGIGGAAGVSLMRLANFLFGIKPWDPATLAVVAATILIASLMACLVPALRALRVDPVSAIRE